MTRARIVVADDHKIFAEGLRRLLEPEFEVMRIVYDGHSLVMSVRELQPDVAIVDISMPGLSGIDATRQILQDQPNTKVVLLTMYDDVAYATTALDEGATAFVLKNADPSELLSAIRQSLLGNVFVAPSLAGHVLRARKNPPPETRSSKGALSPLEREILCLLTKGLTAKEVASRLRISRKSVEYHKYRVMRQLGMKASAELIHYSLAHGIGTS